MSIRGILKRAPMPARMRQTLSKFYLLNFEHASAAYTSQLGMERFRHLLKVWDIIAHEQGYLRSLIDGRCVDKAGEPIPWYSYPAIEYLSQLDFGEQDVFEWGAGNSTLWWSKRARSVTSVEENQPWYEYLRERLPPNCRISHEQDPRRFEQAVRQSPDGYDVISIDGGEYQRSRYHCARVAVEALRPGGIIIVDNSDWLPMTTSFLRAADLIEIDMCGLAPLNDYSCTTSLFLRRDFRVKPRQQKHPMAPNGGAEQDWETVLREDQVKHQPQAVAVS